MHININLSSWLWCIALCTFLVSCNHKTSQTAVIASADSAQAKGDSANPVTGIFDIPEPVVSSAPDEQQSIALDPEDEVISLDVSPATPVNAILIKNKTGQCTLKFWQPGEKNFTETYNLPSPFLAREIKWHPKANALFILGLTDKEYQILRVERTSNGWNTKAIYSTNHELKNLITCSRPFSYYCNTGEYYNYRIFFGEEYAKDLFRTVSVTEHGGRFYQVGGPEKSFTHFNEEEPTPPSTMKAEWALPVCFHPAGHELIWQNKAGNLYNAYYDKAWGNYASVNDRLPFGTSTYFTPNGLGLISWQKNKPGIKLFLLAAHKEEQQLADFNFSLSPCITADGKGVIGVTNIHGIQSLAFIPIKMPLPDVVNAWMFAQNAEQVDLFQKHNGLLRPTQMDQLYKLYDTENYLCDGYDRTVPTRPYLVTTDVFWELYGAAFEGLFVIGERYDAIPAFWNFVHAADDFYKKSNSSSPWAPVFTTLSAIRESKNQSAEIQHINACNGTFHSVVLNRDYDYAELKPRGHYTAEPAMQQYFRAFKYFTTAFSNNDEKIKQELNNLPAETRKLAEQWINSYTGFIAPSRTPLVWSDLKNKFPAYCKFPGTGSTIFPLSWGFDNEVLYRDVYHESAPADQQITGPKGARLLPSGLDLAVVLGNGLADQLLKTEYEKYPPLQKVMNGLRENFKTGADASKSDNLYDKWLYALSMQWLDTLSAPNGKTNESLWQAKRLQTGLASWATLRHATSLVNERGAAECGEGGFEDMLLRAPRGYVEPDPNTFAAIADLLETSVKYVAQSTAQTKDFDEGKQSLHDGIIKRLQETAKEARIFQSIAEREKKGESLTNEDYEKILYLGRIAEHDFLIFKSLGNKDFGLADPEPMAKIADVFGAPGVSPYLMSAVGNTMEWDNEIPYFGRHEIVKGAVYSYFEFNSNELMDDKEWRAKLKSQAFQPWIKSYLSLPDLTYPAATGY